MLLGRSMRMRAGAVASALIPFTHSVNNHQCDMDHQVRNELFSCGLRCFGTSVGRIR